MSTTTIDRPRTQQPESPENQDPMEQYYGRDTFSVAQELFGEDFRGLGTLYSDVDDVPHQMEFTGTAIRDTNMITNQLSGVDGLNGIVISRVEADHLSHARIRNYTP